MLKDPNILTLLSRLLCVPKCASCGETLSPISKSNNLSYNRACLCDKCITEWYQAKIEMCHTCYLPAGECTCTQITRKINQSTIPSLFFYHRDRNKVQNRVLYTIKRKKYTDLFEFIAKELAPSVERLLAAEKISKSDCVLTYIPRNPKSVKKYGLDQSILLSQALARELDLNPPIALLERVGGKEQKKLDRRSRSKNTDESVFLREKFSISEKNLIQKSFPDIKDMSVGGIIENKTVLVLDDIITTGASMRRAILLLEPQKPRRILTLCVARTELKKKD